MCYSLVIIKKYKNKRVVQELVSVIQKINPKTALAYFQIIFRPYIIKHFIFDSIATLSNCKMFTNNIAFLKF
jgi:hypothetical protein